MPNTTENSLKNIRTDVQQDIRNNIPSKLRSIFAVYRLPIVSGFLIGTSYIPFPPWALFFCLVPLLLFWNTSTNPRQAFLGGWITQFILNLIGFHWIAYTAIEFGHFPWWGGVLTLLGFASIAHLHYALAGAIGVWLSRRFQLKAWSRLLVFVTAFALCDHRYPMIFPWHLGYPWLWMGLPGSQFADVIGFEGLNIATIFINGFLALTVISFFAHNRRRAAQFAGAAVAAFLALNLAGLGRAEPWKKTDAEINVLAVQGNIGNFEKMMVEKGTFFRRPIVDKYIELSQDGLNKNKGTDLIIWPETAFPTVLDAGYSNELLAATV